jgi:hypothetical protein
VTRDCRPASLYPASGQNEAAACAVGANHGRSQRVILLRPGAPTAGSARISAVPPGGWQRADCPDIGASADPHQSGPGSAQRRRRVVTQPASSASPCAWVLSWPDMSLAAECALPGVPLALLAAALACTHAGLQQGPGDGRVVLRLAAHHPRVTAQIPVRSRHSRMHLTISARSCSRKPRRRRRPGPPNSQDTGAQTSPSGAPRRDRALRAPAPNGGSVRRLPPVPADWRWPHLLPLTGRPMCHGWGGAGGRPGPLRR